MLPALGSLSDAVTRTAAADSRHAAAFALCGESRFRASGARRGGWRDNDVTATTHEALILALQTRGVQSAGRSAA